MIVAVVGTGLIGGSIGLAARARLGAHVRGTGARAPLGVELGALDEACPDVARAVAGADVAVVCAPVDVLPEVVREVLAHAPAECAVTDVGSTKHEVVRAAGGDPRFVGGHPLAGAEVAGVEHARADLFEGATWYLTPRASTSGLLLERVVRLVTGLGARPEIVEPGDHDRVMAAVSHLPHVLANILVTQAAGALGGGGRMPATGPSFRDATRVAGANPKLWAAIYAANRDALAVELEGAIGHLRDVLEALKDGDAAWLADWQARAAAHRAALLAGDGVAPTRELRVGVPNRPGVIADIALTLARAGINIHDMSLTPSPDNTRGQVALWVREEHAERAAGLIGDLGMTVA